MFNTSINNTKIKTLFETGATKSVMSGKMYRELDLETLDQSNLPAVVGANGSSLGVLGCIRCKISIGKDEFNQTFLVCESLKRGVILGKDFARENCAGIYWTPNITHKLPSHCRNTRTFTENQSCCTSETDHKTTTNKLSSGRCQHQHNQHRQDKNDTRQSVPIKTPKHAHAYFRCRPIKVGRRIQ